MLIMPILNKTKSGTTKIYNVKVSLKTASKVKKSTILKGVEESDIIVNGSSFKNSIYNTKNLENNVIVNFIRNHNYNTSKNNFLVTTRNNSNNPNYDLYNVLIPPRKVTIGLDNLYGKVIIDMQKEIPNIKKGRYISLRDLGVDFHISMDNIEKLKYVVKEAKNEKDLDYLLISNNIKNMQTTIDFIKIFDFTIINESTVYESQITDILGSFSEMSTELSKSLEKYYKIAKDNKEVYKKISMVNQILNGKPINLIQNNNKTKKLVKIVDKSKVNIND